MQPFDPDYDRKCDENAKRLRSEIDRLESGHHEMFERKYRDFWAHERVVFQLFRESKPLRRKDREDLWARFGDICQRVKAEQADRNLARRSKSDWHRGNIIAKIEAARPAGGLWVVTADELRALGPLLREAGQMLSQNKHEMLPEHKQECFDRIQDVRKEHDAWWASFKKGQAERRESFRARVEENLRKNYERHRKATDALQRQKQHAADLESQVASAWNSDWADRRRDWLAEAEDKIRDIEESIDRIEEWIREDQEKLRG